MGHVFAKGRSAVFHLPLFDFATSTQAAGSLKAPMPGKITKVHVAAGDVVEQGQPLLAMEAMKMELTIRAPTAGVVKTIYFAEGEQVAEKAVLAVVVEEEEEEQQEGKK